MADFALINNEGKTFYIETTKNGFEVPFSDYPYVMDLNDEQIRKLKNWINRQLREKDSKKCCAVCKSVGHSMIVVKGVCYCGKRKRKI